MKTRTNKRSTQRKKRPIESKSEDLTQPKRSIASKGKHKYTVALSFAGCDRSFAETIADGLRQHRISVFYDKFEQHALWGENLFETLGTIYNRDCRYCIMVLTDEYLERMWTNYERQQAIERLAEERGKGYILPVRLNGFDKDVPGLPKGVGYLSTSSEEPDVVVATFLKKIGKGIGPRDSKRAYEEAQRTA